MHEEVDPSADYNFCLLDAILKKYEDIVDLLISNERLNPYLRKEEYYNLP
jgi:hypothetical protein